MISFRRDDHVVMSTQLHAQLSPSIEMVADCDGSAHTLGLTYTPVLLEGRRALDRWLIVSSCLEDVIC